MTQSKVEQWMKDAARQAHNHLQQIIGGYHHADIYSCHVCDELAQIIAAHAPTPAPPRKIDGKFSMKYGVSGGQIINTVSGEVIPEDEPLFLIRGRDNNAIAGITSYLNICKKRGCNELHLAGIKQTLEKFRQFAAEHPERMKQPGITKHLKLEASAPPPDESAPTNLAEMSVNRRCQKCGWVHATGSNCPSPDAVFGPSSKQEGE